MLLVFRESECTPDWLSTTVVLNHPNTATLQCIVMIPDHRLFLLPLYNCKFAVRNHDVNICFLMVLGNPCERIIWPPWVVIQRLKMHQETSLGPGMHAFNPIIEVAGGSEFKA